MPVKIGTLLNDLATRVGYDTTGKDFTDLLSANLEIPDSLSSALGKLLTEEGAKNSPVIKNHFFKQALDAADQRIVTVMDELEFDDDSRGELMGIKNTYERIQAVAKKIKELEGKKADGGKEKASLQEKINQLNQEKSRLIAEKDEEIRKMRSATESELTDFMLRQSIATANLASDQFEKPVMIDIANQYITKELSTVGAKVVKKDGTLKLVQASDEALDYYHNNKAISFEDFRDSTLAKYKLLAVNKPAQPAPGTPTTPSNQPNVPARNNSFQNLIERARKDFGE